jgi:hypothetical protein
VGPRAGLDAGARRKICPCRGSNLDRPIVQPIVRQPYALKILNKKGGKKESFVHPEFLHVLSFCLWHTHVRNGNYRTYVEQYNNNNNKIPVFMVLGHLNAAVIHTTKDLML